VNAKVIDAACGSTYTYLKYHSTVVFVMKTFIYFSKFRSLLMCCNWPIFLSHQIDKFLVVLQLLGCHGPLANRQPGRAFIDASTPTA
jgi:hypothetical protein